jgi:hypothetical protein
VEIGQVCAIAGGCVPGDAPGFPVSISTAGSYVLTSNLSVPGTGTSAIRILANDVQVDLNGFSLLGPVTCTGSGDTISCTGGVAGIYGVFGDASGVTVRNGIIRGFNAGVILGHNCVVERVILSTNATAGILARQECRLIHNVLLRNGGNGIDTDRGAVIYGNVAVENGGAGIRMRSSASTLRANVAASNGGSGVVCVANCVVEQNSISFNTVHGLESAGDGTIANGNAVCSNGSLQMSLSNGSGYVNNVVVGSNLPAPIVSGIYMPDNVCNGLTGFFCYDPPK